MVIKKFDCSMAMAKDIIKIDQKTFKDIEMNANDMCKTFKAWEYYHLYVAYLNDEAVGFIGLMKAITPHYKGWWIDLLGVIPEKQGRGVGSKLIAFAKENYKEEGSIMTALIRRNNFASIKAVERNGLKSEKDVDFGLFILD